MNTSVTAILITVQLLVPLVLLLLPIYLLFKERHWSKSIPHSNDRPPRTVKAIEGLVLVICVTSFVANIATGGIGLNEALMPTSVLYTRGWICGIAVLIALVWIMIGWWRSMPIAVAGMVFSAVFGLITISVSRVLSSEHFEDEIRRIPLPVEISLIEKIPDVDVFINGVRMGQAPLQTSIEEIEAKTTEMSIPQEEFFKGHKNLQGGGFLLQQRVKLDKAREVRVGPNHQREEVNFTVRLERHGLPVMISSSMNFSGGSRYAGRIVPAHIPLGVMTEEWDRDIQTLLNKARLADYRVDQEWFIAADTYLQFVRNALTSAIKNEPQFRQVLNDWVRVRYQFDQQSNAETAWRVFESICQQANQVDEYQTNSIEGDAVELLIENIDKERLVELAEKRLKQFGSKSIFIVWQATNNIIGQPCFSTPSRHYAPVGEHSNMSGVKPSDYVLAHAIWKLDQKWDVEGVAHDNPIERKVAPLLMRSSVTNPQARHIASTLGGSTVDEFNRRQLLHVYTFEPSSDPSQNHYLGMEGFILRSFWESVNSDSPSGAKFRRDRSQQCLELAERLITKTHLHFSLPKWMNFLFLDVEGDDPIAKNFLKTFKAKIGAEDFTRQFAVTLEWTYLSRMHPLPDASEFVSSFTKNGLSPHDIGQISNMLRKLPFELMFDVVNECIEEADRIRGKSQENTETHRAMVNAINELNSLRLDIPTEEAVDMTMVFLNPANPMSSGLGGQIQYRGMYGGLTEPLMARLAKSTNPEHRKWVIPQIRNYPNTINRRYLASLIQDDDLSVRQLAEKTSAELESIRLMPLPRLK